MAGDQRTPSGRAHERAEHAHRRRLPSAVRAEDPVDLAGADPERDAAHGVGPVGVALGQRLDDDRVADHWLVSVLRGGEKPRKLLIWHVRSFRGLVATLEDAEPAS